MSVVAISGEHFDYCPLCSSFPSKQKTWFFFGFVALLFIAVAGRTASKQLTVNRLRASWPPDALKLVTCLQTQKTAFLLGCLVVSFPFKYKKKKKKHLFFFFLQLYIVPGLSITIRER